ncbi:MAG TPA: preprotein translocase subunit YajC [Acidimicrobiales bacterium]|nr:preprotein translocase subunit YajC [Acidimicrobiales bacterium]
MGPLIVLAVTFLLLWLLFILPQQRRVRAHQALVGSLAEGDEVVLSAGIFGRVIELGPDEMTLEVAPGVELRVARQAVLRRIEPAAVESGDTDAILDEPAPADGGDPAAPEADPPAGDAAPGPDDHGTTATGKNV